MAADDRDVAAALVARILNPMEQTLLLNATYEPLTIVDWQKAMTLVCRGRVEILAEHDRVARSVSFTFRLPSVVRLLRFVRVRGRAAVVPFTRANIYARDGYTCQYCGETFADRDLTFDHVTPAAQGGTKGWTNIVTACQPCNRRKGPRTPSEAGMTLRRLPHQPTRASVLLRVSIGLRTAPASWRDYLYWHVELEE
jgi:5-methylcytosine-specific restriction endonuclease McrA